MGEAGSKDISDAAIAQLGEHSTEDRKVPGSKPGCGTLFGQFLIPKEKAFPIALRDNFNFFLFFFII